MAHQIAVGALVADGRVLLGHRGPDREHSPNLWSLPGGHIDDGEDAGLALVRELGEELGVEAIVQDEPTLVVADRPDDADGLIIHIWAIDNWTGTPTNAEPDEHDEIRWVSSAEVADLDLAHWTTRAMVLASSARPEDGPAGYTPERGEHRRSLELGRQVAMKLADDPAAGFALARRNLEKPIPVRGGAVDWVQDWRSLVAAEDLAAAVALLIAKSQRGLDMRSVMPFNRLVGESGRAEAVRRSLTN